MSFLKVKLTNIKEPTAAPGGNYAVAINDKEEYTKENGAFTIRLRISFIDHKEFKSMNHFLNFPTAEDDEEKAMNKLRFVRRFLHAFGVQYNEEGFDTDQLMGATANVDIAQEAPNEKGDIYNSIILPPVPASAV